MKHLHETFTDDEFVDLKQLKNVIGVNWHDMIILAFGSQAMCISGSKLRENDFMKRLRKQAQAIIIERGINEKLRALSPSPHIRDMKDR